MDWRTQYFNEKLCKGTLEDNSGRCDADDSIVECYNLDGIPLVELNKDHSSVLVPSLDSYELTTTSIARLGIKSGGNIIEADGTVSINNPNARILIIEYVLIEQDNTTWTAFTNRAHTIYSERLQ